MKTNEELTLELTAEKGLLLFRAQRFARLALRPALNSRNARLLRESKPVTGKKIPVSDTAEEFPSPFFILGHPRSGTTLLREILNRHSHWAIPPEYGAIKEMIRAFRSTRSSTWESVVQRVFEAFASGYESTHWEIDLDAVIEKALAVEPAERNLARLFDLLYREYSGQPDRPAECSPNELKPAKRWGDKSTPGSYSYLRELLRVFPRAQFIHIVRDGRDSVASCIRAGFYNRSLVRAGYAWADNLQYCRELGELLSPEQYCIVSYEKLVTDPETVIHGVCDFLGADFSQKMLPEHGAGASVSPDVAVLGHHSNVPKPISGHSVGKWRDDLSQQSVSVLEKIIRNDLIRFGYPM